MFDDKQEQNAAEYKNWLKRINSSTNSAVQLANKSPVLKHLRDTNRLSPSPDPKRPFNLLLTPFFAPVVVLWTFPRARGRCLLDNTGTLNQTNFQSHICVPRLHDGVVDWRWARTYWKRKLNLGINHSSTARLSRVRRIIFHSVATHNLHTPLLPGAPDYGAMLLVHGTERDTKHVESSFGRGARISWTRNDVM